MKKLNNVCVLLGVKQFDLNIMEYLLTSISSLIILTLFFFTRTTYALLRFQLIYSTKQNDYSTNIQQEELYVTKGAKLDIYCLYSSTKDASSKTNCSEISWLLNKTRFGNRRSNNHCVSILHIEKVWWEGKQSFVCVYKRYKDDRQEEVESKTLEIISGDKPRHVPEPTIQWIEDEVDITWLPSRDNNLIIETSYTVEYSKQGENKQFVKTVLSSRCGLFNSINCSHRVEFYCRASFPSELSTTYDVKLIARNKFGKTAGKSIKVNISPFQQEMKLKPVKDLRVFLTDAGVAMKWSDFLLYKELKKVWYRCQGSPFIQRIFTYSDIYEISKDNLPVFTYCTFCVSRQRYEDGQFSCDKCNVIRTAEDIPKAIPKLKSCQDESCPFVQFGILKNVTISWQLPLKRLWNGIITRQLIFYYEENERMLKNITIRDSNVTEWTLDRLVNNKGYHVYMVICTQVGCGRKSNIIYISGLQSSSVSLGFSFFSDKANTGLLIGLTLAGLGVGFLIIFVSLYIKRHAGGTLPPLHEPELDAVEQESSRRSLSHEPEYDLLERKESSEL